MSAAAGMKFCIFCSQFQEELFSMHSQQQQSKKKGIKKEGAKG
jgi:hypothetical protein